MGNTLLKKGEMDDAIHEFQEAVRINPNDSIAYSILSNCLVIKRIQENNGK